jgi:tetratricopeptide (TPR) repeat protein
METQDYPSDKTCNSTMAELLLKLGLLNWRRGEFDRSEQLLLEAKKITTTMKNPRFLAQCFVGLALVNTRLEKVEDAIDAYHQAIGLEPNNFHLWNNLGNLYLKYQKPDKALSAFKQSIYHNSNDVIAWNGLAKAYYQNNAVDEAIYAYKHTIDLMQETDPKQPIASTLKIKSQLALQWFQLAALYTKKSQYFKAVDAYQKIISLDAGNTEVWNELGKLYIKMEAYKESIDAFSKAIELNPQYGEAYLNLAYSYTKIGNHRESIPFYMKSIEMLPNQRARKLASKLMLEAVINNKNINYLPNEENKESGISLSAHNGISWFYYKYNEKFSSSNISYAGYSLSYRKKRTITKVALRNFSDPICDSKVQKTITGEENMPCLSQSSGEQQLQKKSTMEPGLILDLKTEISNPNVWNEKGNIHFKVQDYKEAIDSYSKAIELDPSFGQPFHNLALTHFILGNYNEAILLYQECIKLFTTDPEKAIAWNGLGNVYRCIKDYENVAFAYQQASKLDKSNEGLYGRTTIFEVSKHQKTASFWRDLGRLLYKTGSYEKAASIFQKAIQLEPASGHSHSYLARALTAQGRYKEAVALYRKSIDLLSNEKEKSNVWNWLGDVYRKLNDYDNALKAYQNATALSNDKFSLLSRTRFSLLSNCAAK